MDETIVGHYLAMADITGRLPGGGGVFGALAEIKLVTGETALFIV